MTAKEYLKQYKEIEVKLSLIEDEIINYETMAGHITTATDSVIVQSSKTIDRIGDIAANLADLKLEAMEYRSRLITQRAEITKILCKLKDARFITVLYLRYIKLKTWEQISVEIGHYLRHTHRIHGKALQELEKILIKDGIE
ncbi:hypothetical protein SAMN02910327_00409 [Peptostreptococcaceae bacterium pGA-8]|nr:hypothetical protein SAMN02910327_00409 [Peptostreptococcaceae bacterium pGA-8]